MKALVLAGGYDQIALINELKTRGVDVLLADYLDNPPAKGHVKKHYQISTLDTEKVKEVAQKEQVDIITTACTDQALLTAAKVSEELKLPCYISYKTALEVTNKLYMKKRFSEGGIPSSKYIITDKADNQQFENMRYPFVVKPVDCNSSKGVTRVQKKEDLSEALQMAIEFSRTKTAIVEEYKEGNEISVDAYVKDGIATILCMSESVKIQENENKFTIVQSRYPVEISDNCKKSLEKIAQQIADVFELKNCPLLIQVIQKEDNISVLEFSARMGGGSKYKFIEVATGLNIMKSYVDLILSHIPDYEVEKEKKYIHMNYCYCNEGKIARFENFHDLKQNGIISEYFLYKTPGSVIEKAENSSDRAAGYLVLGKTYQELIEKEKLAEEKIEIISSTGIDMKRGL